MEEQDRTEPELDPAASDEASPEDAIEGDQGQDPQPANAGEAGFDPNRPVRTSPPAPDEQSGVPTGPSLPENEGVEANEEYRGPVEPTPASGE